MPSYAGFLLSFVTKYTFRPVQKNWSKNAADGVD